MAKKLQNVRPPSSRKAVLAYVLDNEVGGETKDFLSLVMKYKKRGAVLDLGDGEGKKSIYFAKHGFEGHGVDAMPEAIKRARALASKNRVQENTHFRVGNIFELPYPRRFFDVVIDSGCLHHLKKGEWENYLSSIFRVLKDDAFFLLSAFSVKDRHVPNRNRERQYVAHQNHYDYFFKKQDIRNLFKEDFFILKITEETRTAEDGLRHSFYHFQMRRKPRLNLIKAPF